MNCAREIVGEIEGHGVALRVRDGRLQIARADRLPGHLVGVAQDAEAELVTFLEERKQQRLAEQARRDSEAAAAKRDAEMELLPPSRLIGGDVDT